MNLSDVLRQMAGRPAAVPSEGRSAVSWDEFVEAFQFGGLGYGFGSSVQTLGHTEERVDGSFTGVVQGAYRANGVVFACMLVRQMLFAEARFCYRQRRNGRPGDLFSGRALAILERPYAGGTTGALLTRAIQDADLAGNWFGVRMAGGIRRLRPDWVTIVLGSNMDPDHAGVAPDAEVAGYLYHPGGVHAGADPYMFVPGEVAHFAPVPDPVAHYRGMSWLTPVLREITADLSMSKHQQSFFEKGATPNMVVTLDREIKREAFDAWIKAFEANHQGATNAYKTLYLGAGADVEVVGADMKALDFKQIKGHGETRIAAAAGVPPVIVGLSEGLQAATYSNYGQARRRFADGTMRPLWRSMADALAQIVDVPADAELWYDARDVPFLQEDEQDKAEIQATQARAIRSLVDAGFDAASVVDSIQSDDMGRLVHSGLFSVQLQKPGSSDAENSGPIPSPDRALAALVASTNGGS